MKDHVSKLEAAQMLGVSLRTIDNMVRRGELPVTYASGRARILRGELERLGKSIALAVRRPVPAEVIPQESTAETLFDTLIERKLAKMAASAANSILEPFFQSRAVANEIRRGQTLAEQAKWKLYYAKYGCLVCETKAAPHDACGMCQKCYLRTVGRLKTVVKQAEDVIRRRAPLLIHDLTAEAQAALEPPEDESED